MSQNLLRDVDGQNLSKLAPKLVYGGGWRQSAVLRAIVDRLNSASDVTEFSPTQSTRVKLSRRPQWNRKWFLSYLRLMDLYAKLKIIRMMEYIPSNSFRGIFGFYGSLSAWFQLVA